MSTRGTVKFHLQNPIKFTSFFFNPLNLISQTPCWCGTCFVFLKILPKFVFFCVLLSCGALILHVTCRAAADLLCCAMLWLNGWEREREGEMEGGMERLSLSFTHKAVPSLTFPACGIRLQNNLNNTYKQLATRSLCNSLHCDNIEVAHACLI